MENEHKLDFHTDGYIFTPLNEPYPTSKTNTGRTWYSTLKWKPEIENTIDFYVTYDKSSIVSYGNVDYVKAHLFVGKQVGNSYTIGDFEPKQIYDLKLKPDDYQFMYIPIINKRVHSLNDKLDIQSGIIVECSWRNLSDTYKLENVIRPRGWVPNRVRLEKTQKLQKDKSYQGTCNNERVAYSIWDTIMNPIPIESVFEETLQKGVYYEKQRKEQVADARSMNLFHNYVKYMLISRYQGQKGIDFTCGRGGEINKWGAFLSSIIGLDLSSQNIVILKDRLKEQREYIPHVFADFDSSKKLFDMQGNMISDNWSSNMVDFSNVVGTYNQMRPLDVAMAFFSVHYFMGKKESLDGLFWNLSKSLKVGGNVLITCIDGDHLFNKLKEYPKGQTWELVLGGSKGGKVFSIRKNYENTEYNQYGCEIEVMIHSISDTYYSEYIVYKSLIDSICKEYGFRISEERMFSEVPKTDIQNPSYRNSENLLKIPQLLEFSNMHKYYVLEKVSEYAPTEKPIPKRKPVISRKKNTSIFFVSLS
jgi:hypothetical protein